MPEDHPVETTSEPVPKFEWIKDSAYRSVYSNQTQFASTAFDFSMTFGEIEAVEAEAARVTVDQRVRVVMSPLHFKIFVMVCAQNLKGYEERFGEITVPSGSVSADIGGGKSVPIIGT